MNRVFILGAGFSHHLSGGVFPLMKDLGEELKSRYEWISEYLPSDENSQFDLEAVLTRLDLDQIEKTITSEEYTSRTSDIENLLIEQLSLRRIGEDELRSAERLCCRLFSPGDVIITFNYDCLLEYTLWRLGRWHPKGGYGQIPELYAGSFGRDLELRDSEITILKLHSSLNFYVFPGTNYLTALFGNDAFPERIVNWDVIGETRGKIVLPSFVKIFGDNRTLILLWQKAIKSIQSAEELIVIGYSLPPTDSWARILLSFLTIDNKDVEKLRVAILNGRENTGRVKDEMFALGQFGEEHIEFALFSNSNDDYDEEYERLCDWLRRR